MVVATRDRPDDLRKCLQSLRAQASRRSIEIVIVDNHPGSGVTPAVVAEFPDVRLVSERRPGLSYARNAGIVRSTGEIILSTDDDVVAPPDWVEKLVAPFADPQVMVATGNVLPGKIVRLTEFGAFVELYEGIEGLVHVSELANERDENPEDKFRVGQDVRVKIIKMDPVERKIGLSIKAAIRDAELAEAQGYAPGQTGGATLGDVMASKLGKLAVGGADGGKKKKDKKKGKDAESEADSE